MRRHALRIVIVATMVSAPALSVQSVFAGWLVIPRINSSIRNHGVPNVLIVSLVFLGIVLLPQAMLFLTHEAGASGKWIALPQGCLRICRFTPKIITMHLIFSLSSTPSGA